VNAAVSDAVAPAPERGRERRWLFALLALALVVRSFGFTEPWSGYGFRSAFATVTTGCNARNFAEHGILAAKAMPYYWRVELADGALVHEYYTHHPALFALVGALSLELFGPREWALTLPYLLFSLASIAAVWKLAREWWGLAQANLAGFFVAIVPLSAWYGTLAWIDGLTITFHALAALCWLRWMRTNRTAHLWRGALCMFGAGLCDWAGGLILPGLGAFALVWSAKRGWGKLAPALLYPLGFGCAVLVHWLHMRAVLPPELVRGDTQNTLSWVQQLPDEPWVFLRAQLEHQLKLLTLPVCVLLALAWLWQLARIVRGRACFEQGLLFALFPPGFLYIALVPGRSINHEFFSFVSLPWMGLSFAWLLSSLRVDARHLATRAALVLLAAFCTWRTAEIWRGERREGLAKLVRSEWLAPLLDDPRAVIVTSTGAGLNLPFYSRAPVIPGIDTIEQLEALKQRVLAHVGAERRIVFLFDHLRGVEAFAPLRDFLGQQALPIPHLALLGERPPIAFEEYDLASWAARR
jgi:hypothetical protein